jgi:2-polyprenyl-6-methoxyphenol hydroxylase-like FAD-dependent oxidoreductase
MSTDTLPHRPEVIIVGAGIGGLVLAQLLEQIDIPYHIYERAAVIKPLGTSFFSHTMILSMERRKLYPARKKLNARFLLYASPASRSH